MIFAKVEARTTSHGGALEKASGEKKVAHMVIE
jgi:hypothetical protein